MLIGALVLTPALVLGVGGLIGFTMGKRGWRQALATILACALAAAPAFALAQEVGEGVRELRNPAIPIPPLPEKQTAVSDLIREKGWTLLDRHDWQTSSSVLYEQDGQTYLAMLWWDPRTGELQAMPNAPLTKLEQAYSDFQGVPVRLRLLSLETTRFEAQFAEGGKVQVDTFISLGDDQFWRLTCQSWHCPKRMDITVPLKDLHVEP